MFGKNEIVGQKYFQNAGDQIFVTSVFMTLQGEGPYRGEPAVFVRLAKCNLACSFCDTWFDSGDWLTLFQLEKKIWNAMKSAYPGTSPTTEINVPSWLAPTGPEGKYHCGLVITGGEPMLQKNLSQLLKYFEKQFDWMQIESNGTLLQELTDNTTLVCSPKCSEKNGKPVKYLEPKKEVLERANCLKFVMNADPDSPYSQIPEWAMKWKEETGRKIFISPMNVYNKEPERNKAKVVSSNDRSLEQRSVEDEVISFWEPGLLNMQQNKLNHEYAAKYCLNTGCIMNLQIHLYASLA